MNDIRIIFSDLDGTLLNSAHHIPAATAQTLHALRQKGVVFCIVSARQPAAIRPFMRELGFSCPYICYGGALILNADGKEIEQTRMDGLSAREVFQFARKHRDVSCFGAYEGDCWWAQDVLDPLIQTESRITGVTPRPFPPNLDGMRPHKFMFIVPQPERCNRVLADLAMAFPSLRVVYSGFGNIEVTAKEVSKSSAMQRVCTEFGLSVRQAAAFGDSLNDADMLRAAGLGVAVANASGPVKACADQITLSNDEEGVRHALEKIFRIRR